MKKNLSLEDEELKELKDHIEKNTHLSYFIFGGFLLLALSMTLTGVVVPWINVELIALILLLNFFHLHFFEQFKPTVQSVSRGYLLVHIAEVIAILAVIHFFGAVPFGGVCALMIYVLFAYFGFTRIIYPQIITIVCIVGFIDLTLLEYYGILPYHDLQNLGVNVMENKNLFLLNIVFMTGFLLCTALYSNTFSKKFRGIINNLTKKETELNEARTILEIKVRARTRELRELVEKQEGEIKRRTNELQARIKELERFQKLTVGRELTMVEIKKKIKELGRKQEEKKIKG